VISLFKQYPIDDGEDVNSVQPDLDSIYKCNSLSDLLRVDGMEEADFTGYYRAQHYSRDKPKPGRVPHPYSLPNTTYHNIGGEKNNHISMVVVGYVSENQDYYDEDVILLAHFPADFITDGGSLDLEFDPQNPTEVFT
jgi:hypothetical protein